MIIMVKMSTCTGSPNVQYLEMVVLGVKKKGWEIYSTCTFDFSLS